MSSQPGWGGEVRVSKFSSPYKVRVFTERVEVVSEQINLESGEEETVSEIQERVFVDLTGNVEEDFAELPSDGDVNDNLVNYSGKE